jgi:hypothetical protein
MKRRLALATFIAVLAATVSAVPAQANTRPGRLQELAVKQTQQLFRFYTGTPQDPQVASPTDCSRAQQQGRVLLLPTLSFGTGPASFRCRTSARSVLVDLSGATATEDTTSTYTLADGEVVTFARANLQRICTDVVRFLSPAPATLDGHVVTGSLVVTRDFMVMVNRRAEPFFTDSRNVGHPGTLTACYAGFKTLVRVAPGHHVLRVDLSSAAGAGTVFTYDLNVRRS